MQCLKIKKEVIKMSIEPMKLFFKEIKEPIEIAKLSGKDVFCIETRELVNPSFAAKTIRGQERSLRLLLSDPAEALKKCYRFLRRHLLKNR